MKRHAASFYLKKQGVLLLSGLPGVGKTTLARLASRKFGIPLLSKDLLQSSLRRLQLTDRATSHGYHLLFDLTSEQVQNGLSVILDAVFPMSGYREIIKKIADQNNIAFLPIHLFCSDRETWKKRINSREGNIPNWSPVTWDEVKRLESVFEPWDPETTLYLDTMNPIYENIASIKRWAQGQLKRN